ncbi:MAG: PKD domain-containing protein [Niabella sp.]
MHFSLSKKWAGIDFKVWVTFIVLTVLSAGLLSYKVATNVPCPAFTISATGKLNHPEGNNSHTFYVNEQITFTASLAATARNITWDFDDGSDKKSGASVLHTYIKEGYYLVKAIVNGECIQSFNIRITQSNTITNTVAPAAISPIISADIISLGDEAVFNTSAVGANYEWSVEELPDQPKQTANTAKFAFVKPGNFTVVLKVDDNKVYRKLIQVVDNSNQLGQAAALPPVSPIDAPPVPQEPLPAPDKTQEDQKNTNAEAEKQEPVAPPAKVYDQLPEPAIRSMLDEVIAGKKGVEDFNNILCNGAGTKVMANNQSTTFAALCNELKEKKGVLILKKKRKIQSFKVVRDDANGNCVKIIYIEYK